MKTILICPAIRPAVPQLAEASPLATVPLFGECLVTLWIEHVAALGAKHVTIIAADRADQVKAAVGDGRRWGVHAEVMGVTAELTSEEAITRFPVEKIATWMPAPHDVITLSHLPGAPEYPLFESYQSWYAALRNWMPRALSPARVRMVEVQPQVWVGSRARIAPDAQLHAPCWIGDLASIGPEAIVGPGAIVEDRAVVDVGARVEDSVVDSDTYVGRMTKITRSLASGSTLINWQTDSVLRVPDRFLLSALVSKAPTSSAESIGRQPARVETASSGPLSVFGALISRLNRAEN